MQAISKKIGVQLLACALYAFNFQHANAEAPLSDGSKVNDAPYVSAPAGSSDAGKLPLSPGVQAAQEPALAEHDKLCDFVRPQQAPGEVVVWQHRFDDGRFDLAIAQWRQGKVAKMTRLSFKGSQQAACHFNAVAIIKGGDWGWHIAWSSNSSTRPGVYYARLDGDAWVTSPPRQMSSQAADAVELNEQAGKLLLKYTTSHIGDANVAIATSEDDGRNWEIVPPSSVK